MTDDVTVEEATAEEAADIAEGLLYDAIRGLHNGEPEHAYAFTKEALVWLKGACDDE